MKRSAILSLILALSLPGVPLAQAADMKDMGMEVKAQQSIEAVGVVKQVDKAKKIVTIAHEAIPSLGWSAMTMDFVVENKALFAKLIPGKQIHFGFITQGYSYVVTSVK
ncbi:MAG: copper-binding protein [Nitrosomonadales bacterium]|nr:copper-binding protein [Nitrosomonadales bacterium]